MMLLVKLIRESNRPHRNENLEFGQRLPHSLSARRIQAPKRTHAGDTLSKILLSMYLFFVL